MGSNLTHKILGLHVAKVYMLKSYCACQFEAHDFLFKIKKIHGDSLNIVDFTAIFEKFLNSLHTKWRPKRIT